MRASTKPHALSDHAALAALTAVERGRLDHIARSIPPDHSAVVEPPAMSTVLRGRPLLLRWVAVVTAAEALGFVVPATVGAATTTAADSVVVPALVAAGLFEGTLLGLGQAMVLRRAVPDLSRWRWVAATAAGAMLAYALGMLPATLAKDWPPAMMMAGAGVLGALILLTIGGSQWLVLRSHLQRAHRWVLITAVAWFAGMAVFLGVSTPLWQNGQSLVTTIGVGIFGGLLMATVTACITGVGLVRMLALEDEIG